MSTAQPNFIGIDPDLHTTAFAQVGLDKSILGVGVAKVPAKFKGTEAVLRMIAEMQRFACNHVWVTSTRLVCVEGQELYVGKTKNPKDILALGQVAGGCVAAFAGLSIIPDLAMPLPKEWKGGVPKRIHHARIYGSLGIAYKACGTKENGYAVPLDPVRTIGKVLKSDWKHIGDAIGLALWAREQWVEAQKGNPAARKHIVTLS